MQQATDFLEESRALAAIIEPLSDAELKTVTQFKGWTIEDVLGHLHMFNVAADLTLESREKFGAFFGRIVAAIRSGSTMLESQHPWLEELGIRESRPLVDAWREGFERTAANYAAADPKERLAWGGPEMSTRSCITARQMETWAHGHEVFDVLGVERTEADRLKNIVVLGVNTFGWTHSVRKVAVPEVTPFIELTAPSGAVWTFGKPSEDEVIRGSALGFAQTVTQTRNVADTDLQVTGPVSRYWMDNAQCFAGGVEQPPAPGTRTRRT